MTISRGVRLPESRFMRIYEIWQDARKNHKIQVNDVINILLELGITTFARLPDQLRHTLFSPRNAQADLRLRADLDRKATEVASANRCAKVSFRIPRNVKESIQHEAQRAETTMSDVIRRRITMMEAAQ